MRRNAGFTMVEMVVATALFAAGSLYVYSTFAGVTQSTRSSTVQIDLGSQNKRALTRIYNELQATSLTPQDTDGVDSTEPEAVFEILSDTAAPAPRTDAKLVNRVGETATQGGGGEWSLGGAREQARERVIDQSKRIRFRKVVGYDFNAGAGSIVPEWSGWISYSVNPENQLVRTVEGQPGKVVAHDVDALDAVSSPDGTVVLVMVTAKRNPTGPGWRRYANAVTVNPKNRRLACRPPPV
jgi:prepilin-type N-terminal cleavage/methylation domain-containing protein